VQYAIVISMINDNPPPIPPAPPELPDELGLLRILHQDADSRANIVAAHLKTIRDQNIPLTTEETEALRLYKLSFERAIDRVHAHINQYKPQHDEERLRFNTQIQQALDAQRGLINTKLSELYSAGLLVQLDDTE
jgi:transposase